MPDVEADQERGDLFQDARIFQFAAVDGAHAGNLCGQRLLLFAWRLRIITADDHVAVDRTVGVQNFGGSVVKRGHDRNSLGYEFGSLLRGRALPDAESAGGAATDARRQRHGSVDHDAAGTNGGS